MENKLKLTQEEITLIELAIVAEIQTLYQRFNEEAEYVHPAKKYESLYHKLTEWLEPLPAGSFSITSELQ